MTFKAFKAPAVSVSIEIAKDSFVLGETVAGSVRLASGEELEAKEVRIELLGTEKAVAGEESVEEPGPETPETRLYSPEENYSREETRQSIRCTRVRQDSVRSWPQPEDSTSPSRSRSQYLPTLDRDSEA